VDTYPHSSECHCSSDMAVSRGSTQVPDAMAVDKVPKPLAMVVHYVLWIHSQKNQMVMASKVMKPVGSVERGGCISSTDLMRLTSLYWASRPL
jgi:hypothetical protein